ncbi:MAG: lipocalin family protein [Marinilabiliales bacterium]|nr:lipocalin family protein [Marinilabiliales bacterium]
MSCSKDDIPIDHDNLLIGTWTFSSYQEDVYIFERNNEFIDNMCYKFNQDGTVTERKNSGWCGTPPISYADYPGTWTIAADKLIHVDVGYWGGTMSYSLDIVSVDSAFSRPEYYTDSYPPT